MGHGPSCTRRVQNCMNRQDFRHFSRAIQDSAHSFLEHNLNWCYSFCASELFDEVIDFAMRCDDLTWPGSVRKMKFPLWGPPHGTVHCGAMQCVGDLVAGTKRTVAYGGHHEPRPTRSWLDHTHHRAVILETASPWDLLFLSLSLFLLAFCVIFWASNQQLCTVQYGAGAELGVALLSAQIGDLLQNQ